MLLNNKYQYNPKTDLLGVGGFGRVYKALDTLLERDVALKMVNIEGAKAHYSLVEEIKKAINLHHPNIIKYYDVFTLKGENFTGEETETQVGVMEYIPHGDISQLDWNTLPPDQQKDILLQILDGLGYLHQNKIIHRDIKPSNILIKKDGGRIIPKITDFGISKSQDAASVSVSRVIGSIPYMAPEQFDSKGRASYNTDFWSLGILIYRLFTGTLPFGDESTTSEGVIMKNIMEAPMPQEVQQIPLPFRTLVELCLVKDRAERVKDAEVLVEVLQGSQVKAQPLAEELKTQATLPEDETDPTSAEEETTRILHYEQEKRAPGAPKHASASKRKKGASTIPGQNIVKNNRKTVYRLISISALLLIIGLIGVQYFTIDTKKLAGIEAAEQLAYEEEEQELRQKEEEAEATRLQEEQQRLEEERRQQQEQARIAVEQKAEEQRQKEEQARLAAERLAEEQRQKEEQARLNAERFAEEDWQRKLEEQQNWEEERERSVRAKSGTFTDNRDGQTYNWVRIGDQVWMAENLNFNAGSGSSCYDNNSSNCNKYGRLYDWQTARNACPAGWRLPTNSEWKQLISYIGDSPGTKLSKKNGWTVSGKSVGGSDEFNFSALPGGIFRHGSFQTIGSMGYWHSSTKTNNKEYKINYFIGGAYNMSEIYFKDFDARISVRCILD